MLSVAKKNCVALQKKTLKLPRNVVEGHIAIILSVNKVVLKVPSEKVGTILEVDVHNHHQ